MRTRIQKSFSPLRSVLPGAVSRPIRKIATALIARYLFASRTGHFKSSLRGYAVTPEGDAIPWYTYPCIQFLMYRDFTDRTILEFGGGQSTVWWAKRAKKVITVEQDRGWYEQLKTRVPSNVDLNHVSAGADGKSPNWEEVRSILARHGGEIDISVNDGTGERSPALDIVRPQLSKDGAFICDDSSGYGFQELTRHWNMNRVDFYGFQPAVVLPNCTSIIFPDGCFLFKPIYPIKDIARVGYEGPWRNGSSSA